MIDYSLYHMPYCVRVHLPHLFKLITHLVAFARRCPPCLAHF